MIRDFFLAVLAGAGLGVAINVVLHVMVEVTA